MHVGGAAVKIESVSLLKRVPYADLFCAAICLSRK